MEELRDTVVPIDGESVPLLSEVDSISGVSGGSFPAAYYGLFGDRIFEDFEARFLKKNVQGALILRVLAPWHLIASFTPFLDRTDLSTEDHPVKTFMITLGFNDLEDEAERTHLNRLPTSFALRPEDVDRLREAGRKLLRESLAFQALLADLHQRDARYRTRAIDRIGERPWIGSVGS